MLFKRPSSLASGICCSFATWDKTLFRPQPKLYSACLQYRQLCRLEQSMPFYFSLYHLKESFLVLGSVVVLLYVGINSGPVQNSLFLSVTCSKGTVMQKKSLFCSFFFHAASRPLFKFVVVTSAKLAVQAGVDDISQVAYHCLNQAVLVRQYNFIITEKYTRCTCMYQHTTLSQSKTSFKCSSLAVTRAIPGWGDTPIKSGQVCAAKGLKPDPI